MDIVDLSTIQTQSNALDDKVNELSHSSLNLLHTCPRKFELYRKQLAEGQRTTVDMSFGSALGAGIAELFCAQARENYYEATGAMPEFEELSVLDQAKLAMFISWDSELFAEKEKAKKSIMYCELALEKFYNLNFPILCEDWEIASFKNKPAAELGFKILLPNNFSYRGYVDLVLKHKREKRYKVLELKTTGSYSLDIAMYKNSFQGVGYGVVLDYLAQEEGYESDYYVDYLVYKTKSMEFETYPFLKTNLQRVNWLNQLYNQTKVIELYKKDGFPQHGESCFSYMRQCEYFGICEMSNEALLGGLEELEKETVSGRGENFDFYLNFEDLVTGQLKGAET